MQARRFMAVTAVAIAIPLMLVAGCASPTRSAAPAESAVPSAAAPSSTDATDSPEADDSPDSNKPKSNLKSYLDTRLEITNKTGWTKTILLGAGCIDPMGLLPQQLTPDTSIAAVGWCGVSDADVTGAFALGNIITGYQWIYFKAGNPRIGWPWIEVDGVSHNFGANESCAFKTQGQIFEAYRGVDLSGAKDMRLTWVNDTNLAKC